MVSFLQNFQPSVLCSSSFLCETYSPNLILLVLMLIIIFDEEHKLQNSWLCKLGPTSDASFLLDRNILLVCSIMWETLHKE
jgi:hypothetical protein